MKLRYAVSVLASAALMNSARAQYADDLWDVTRGAVITAESPIITYVGTPDGLLGANGQQNWGDELNWTYFADAQPPGTVHFVEWETPADVTVAEVRIYAYGDGPTFYNNGREFEQVVIKAKSPGSSTYDLTLISVTPTHPY